MELIDNAWTVVRKSYAVWLGQFMGWFSGYLAFLASLSPVDQETLHAAAQLHWGPILIAFLGIVGIPAARATYQPNLPNK